ncbi:MAG: hypothetical protein COX19_01175 [Desulfobacterales bacterium CG23_combo_of_CG06-09_8_20_14_all_51_8]|nr:MAG: hypothetical protein COX19_01175 [Desulfobacterales bacterium CG23_combo_of_CG06-09_8_20_14_all_51_8]
MNILVVDDEERIRSVFCKIFQREGFHVIEAACAADAYDLLLENPADLILLDINMMEVDGTILYDVVQLFRKEAKVIVTSVYPLEDQKRLIQGAEDYYDKSDSLGLLVQKVKKVADAGINSAASGAA